MLRQRSVPGDDLGRADEVQPCGRQRGHVQRLAHMAGGIGPIRMFVEERTARGEIEQRDASQQRQRATSNGSSKNGFLQIHPIYTSP